jgi:ABC-type multidrug transport system fused ATPase/permease subunit
MCTITLFIVFFYQLFPPFILGKIIDFFTQYTPGDSLTSFYIYVGILGIAHFMVAMFRLTAKNRLANLEAEARYHAKVWGFERLLDFSLGWHDSENTGNKVQRILSGTAAIRSLQSIMSQTGFSVIAAISGIFTVFLFLNPIFAVFAIGYMGIFFIIHFAFYHKQLTLQDELNKAQEQASGVYYEGVNNVLTLKTLGAKDTFKENIFSNEKQAKDFMFQTRQLAFKKWKSFQTLNAISIAIYLFLVGQGVVQGTLTVGSILMFANYLYKLIESVADSTDVIEQFIESKSAIGRMMPIYWTEMKIKEGSLPFPIAWKELKIVDGSFQYQPDDTGEKEYALKDINITIQKHEKIGVVGHSGSGKSTLSKVLLGLYELEKGIFTIDHTNFYDLKHSEITHNIAIVLQDSEMFNLSLRDNITLMREVDTVLLEKAIRIAQLEDLIGKLPEGMDTLIGEKGYRLSGGERQRLGIARAICKDPQILVLDEATSSLDSKTESLIQEAIENELQKKTLIIIAHRISTLKNVDRIYVFDHGKIVEDGRFHILMNDPKSKFYEVYQSQSKK